MGKINEYPLEATVLQDTDFADLDAFNSGTGLFQSKKISGLNLKDSVLTFITPNLDARDTANRDRANHTGTQDASTITGLAVVATSNDYNDLDNLPVLLTAHSELILDDGTNPHGTTATDVGLGNVDNTTDLNKPISTATQLALDDKQDELISGVNIKTVDGQSILGAGDIPIAVPSGVFGISNATGDFTFYNTLQDAINAATSGMTIQVFANYVETNDVTITLKNGVNINGNGYTYTLNIANATALMIAPNSVTTSCNILNYNINRLNGNADSVTLFLGTNANGFMDFTGSKLKNLGAGRCISSFANANYHLSNLYAEANSNVAGWIAGSPTNNEIRNCTFISNTGNSTRISVYRVINTYGFSQTATGLDFITSIVINCVGRSNGGIAINVTGSTLKNCTGYSTGGAGIVATNSVTLIECTGFSSGGIGINLLGAVHTVIDSKGYSTSSIGISANSNAHIIDNCVAFSSATFGLSTNITSLIVKNSVITSTAAAACARGGYINCVIQCSWDNAAGHGITIANNDVYNCTIITANASANALQTTAATSIFIVENIYKGMTTPVNANITNLQTNAVDAAGNILIG